MSARHALPLLAFTCLFGCKPRAETTVPAGERKAARVDLLPSSATMVLAVNAEAFTEQGYRNLVPWLDDPEPSKAISELDKCYAGDIETVALGAVLDDDARPPKFAAALVGKGIGASDVVTCFAGTSDTSVELWAEDADTLVVSATAWAEDVRAKKPKVSADPLAPVLVHADRDADAWFVVRLPESVDESIRSASNWMSELAARSTDEVIKPKPTRTPTRAGIGFVSGSLRVDGEGLEARMRTSFETRESVDLTHAVVDIGFVLLKHFGSSPKDPSERLAHELVLHTTISRTGDVIEAHTLVSADVLAEAAEQAHSTIDFKKLLGLGTSQSETRDDPEVDAEVPPSALERKLKLAAAQAGSNEEPEPLTEEDNDLVFEACEAIERHVYPLAGCGGELRSQLQEDREAADPMVRCLVGSTSRDAVFACDPHGLLNPELAMKRRSARRLADSGEQFEAARNVFRAELAKAGPSTKQTIYRDACSKMSRVFGKPNSTEALSSCVQSMEKSWTEEPIKSEALVVCALLHDHQMAWMECASAWSRKP
ncbi:MAG: hypothetical protein AAGA54_11560 [Myxococcota bacterium]